MAYGKNARHCAKTADIKFWGTPSLKERIQQAAEEDGTQVSTWLRDLAEHALTMREVRRRLDEDYS